jgi:hypothetical protein
MMNPNLYFILSVLWAMVCRKEASFFQLRTVAEWRQSLIQSHPLRAMYESMQDSDAQQFMQYVNSRTENKVSVIQLHSTEVSQALSLLYPDIWEKFLNEKIEKNQTSCGFRP